MYFFLYLTRVWISYDIVIFLSSNLTDYWNGTFIKQAAYNKLIRYVTVFKQKWNVLHHFIFRLHGVLKISGIIYRSKLKVKDQQVTIWPDFTIDVFPLIYAMDDTSYQFWFTLRQKDNWRHEVKFYCFHDFKTLFGDKSGGVIWRNWRKQKQTWIPYAIFIP